MVSRRWEATVIKVFDENQIGGFGVVSKTRGVSVECVLAGRWCWW